MNARSTDDRRDPGRYARLLATLVIATITVGCTGSASDPGVGTEFAAKAVAVCDHARELKQAQGAFPLPDFNPTQPDVSKFPEVAVFLRKTATTFETWHSEMQALGEPSSGQAAWADLLDQVKRHVDLNADQITAAGRGDSATFSKDYFAGQQTQAALLQAAKAAGVPECAKVDR